MLLPHVPVQGPFHFIAPATQPALVLFSPWVSCQGSWDKLECEPVALSGRSKTCLGSEGR